jgi:hypothetical protein
VRSAARCPALAVAGALGAVLAAALLGPSPGAGDAATAGERGEAALRETAADLRRQLRRERTRHERALRRERLTAARPRAGHAIRVAAAAYGVSAARLRRVAECESRLDSRARNGTYLGLFQFGAPLWSRTPFRSFPRSDPYAAAFAASWAFARGLASHWPVCGRR